MSQVNPEQPYQNFIKSLTNFLNRHYFKAIICQIPKVFSSMEMIGVQLQFDLNLLNDQEPLIGRWIIEFYPSFYKALQRSVHDVIWQHNLDNKLYEKEYDYLEKITIDMIHCEPKFINVPIFNTPIYDILYKTQVLEKAVGSLVHLKNCMIIEAIQPELYLAVQYYEANCGCKGKGVLQINHLIHLLRNNYQNKKTFDNKKQCLSCSQPLTEIKEQRKYQPCQELKVHLNDMAHTNQKKYSNYSNNTENKRIPLTNELAVKLSQRNEEQFMIVLGANQNEDMNFTIKNKKYKLDRGTTFSLFVIGLDVGKFQQGQELHVIAYYCFNLANTQEGRFIKIAQEYFIAVQISLVNHLVNRHFFTSFASDLLGQDKRKQQPTLSQYTQNPKNTQLYDLIQSTHKHYQHTKENVLLQHEIWQILVKISNIQSKFDGMFPLKISLLMSVFWKNKQNISYHHAYNQNKQANIEIQHNEDNKFEITNKIDLCLIYEDNDVIQEVINRTTQGLEDVYLFPQDADDTTVNELCRSLIKGGILIVKYSSKMKKQYIDLIRQILIGNPVQFEKNSRIKLNCTVWFLVPIIEIYQDKKNAKEVVTIQNSPRLADFKNLFDVVLDLSFINNKFKQVNNDFHLDHSDGMVNQYCQNEQNLLVITEIMNQTSQKQRPRLSTDQNTTAKKPKLINYDKAPSVSSCHMVQQNLSFKTQSLTNDQLIKTIKAQNKESLSLLQSYFYKFREEKSVGGGFLNQSYKIAQASALLRHFTYSYVNDKDSLYQSMLLQDKINEPVQITYADVFLSVLLATETRINTFGFSQGLFGSETSKYYFFTNLSYLFNSHKQSYSTYDEYHTDQDEDLDKKYREFRKIYSKIINI